jgi:hypothetical protein
MIDGGFVTPAVSMTVRNACCFKGLQLVTPG